MRNDNKKRPRPRPRRHEIPSRDLFYQTVNDYSDEETQGIFEFMKKLKQADDETCIFSRFCSAIQCYRSGFKTYITLDKHLLSILRDHKDLLDEFHQLKSYHIRPEAEVVSSSNEVLNEKMNNLEDKLMNEDMLMRDLAAVIRFGKDALKDPKLSEKPPLGFNRVLDWFYRGKEVPHPKLAATYMLPIMQTTLEEMTRSKTIRAINAYKHASQKGNVK